MKAASLPFVAFYIPERSIFVDPCEKQPTAASQYPNLKPQQLLQLLTAVVAQALGANQRGLSSLLSGPQDLVL